MVEHRDELAGALALGQVARHLHCLHQYLSQLFSQLYHHSQGPGLLMGDLRRPQCLPVLPWQAGHRHLWVASWVRRLGVWVQSCTLPATPTGGKLQMRKQAEGQLGSGRAWG